MKISIIEYLVCPTCRGELSLKSIKKTKNEIVSGKFSCKNCKETFPIKNGIPRFVKDTAKDFVKTEDSFSAKWRTYHKSYHEKKWFNFQRNWYLERFQWKTLKIFNDFLGQTSQPSSL